MLPSTSRALAAGLLSTWLCNAGCGGEDRPASPTLVSTCATAPARGDAAFVEVATPWGLAHEDLGPGALGWGRGICVLDFDGDERMDLYLVAGPNLPNRLLRNEGDACWLDVTPIAGDAGLDAPYSTHDIWGTGCIALDYDSDGDTDLWVTGHPSSRLLRNDGDGRFSDVSASAGLLSDGIGLSASAGDVDGDGDLDVFVSRPARLDGAAAANECAAATDPAGCEGDRNLLWINQGDGTFREEGLERGLVEEEPTLVGLLFDFDGDGAVDLWAGNDLGGQIPDRLYLNDGSGRFADRAPELGVDFNKAGDSSDTMGIDVGDYDLDGWHDVLLSNFVDARSLLFRCEADPTGEAPGPVCTDRAGSAGLSSRRHLNWGLALEDLDNDRDLDVFLAAGETSSSGGISDERNQVYWNEAGVYVPIEPAPDGGLGIALTSRAAAFGDLDDDGDVDILVNNLGAPMTVLRNDVADGHWLSILLRGTTSNPEGVGARVSVLAAGVTVTEQRMIGTSFMSSQDPRIHFGLGAATEAEVTVVWPTGRTQRVTRVAADRTLTIIEE